VEQSKGLVQL